jgi:hypothetical protein
VVKDGFPDIEHVGEEMCRETENGGNSEPECCPGAVAISSIEETDERVEERGACCRSHSKI